MLHLHSTNCVAVVWYDETQGRRILSCYIAFRFTVVIDKNWLVNFIFLIFEMLLWLFNRIFCSSVSNSQLVLPQWFRHFYCLPLSAYVAYGESFWQVYSRRFWRWLKCSSPQGSSIHAFLHFGLIRREILIFAIVKRETAKKKWQLLKFPNGQKMPVVQRLWRRWKLDMPFTGVRVH